MFHQHKGTAVCTGKINLMSCSLVGGGSVVEPAPQHMEVLRGCGFESDCSPPARPLCHRYAPTGLETKSIWQPPHCNFSVRKHVRQRCDFNF